MPEFTSYAPGTPSWIDHAAKDIGESNSFYSSFFGWDAEDHGEAAGHYTIFRKNGKTVAGNMGIMTEGQPSAWVAYVSVDDADKTVEVAKKAGATLFVEPMDVMDIGRMAVFADPTGAVIAIWQPKTFCGAELANEPGAFCWSELNTRDVAAAKVFYTEVFGWTPNDLEMEGMNYTEWRLGENRVAGMVTMSDMVPAEVPAHWLVYFGTDNTDATVARASELGAMTLAPPTDIPPGRFAALVDPDGAAFAVIKMTPMLQDAVERNGSDNSALDYDTIDADYGDFIGRDYVLADDSYLGVELHDDFVAVRWVTPLDAADFIHLCEEMPVIKSTKAVLYEWENGQHRQMDPGRVIRLLGEVGDNDFSHNVGFLRIAFAEFDLTWQVTPRPDSTWRSFPPQEEDRQNVLGFVSNGLDEDHLQQLVSRTASTSLSEHSAHILEDITRLVNLQHPLRTVT